MSGVPMHLRTPGGLLRSFTLVEKLTKFYCDLRGTLRPAVTSFRWLLTTKRMSITGPVPEGDDVKPQPRSRMSAADLAVDHSQRNEHDSDDVQIQHLYRQLLEKTGEYLRSELEGTDNVTVSFDFTLTVYMV